jgi:hypothetical protein
MAAFNASPRPAVGQLITEGMSHYMVKAADGDFYTAQSWTGITIQIYWHDSGYTDRERHSWRIVPGSPQPHADSPLYRTRKAVAS